MKKTFLIGLLSFLIGISNISAIENQLPSEQKTSEQKNQILSWSKREKIMFIVSFIACTTAIAIETYRFCANNPETIEQLKNIAWTNLQVAYGTAITYKDFAIAWAISKASLLKDGLFFALNTIKNQACGIAAKKSLKLEERFIWLYGQTKNIAINLYKKLWPWATRTAQGTDLIVPQPLKI